MSSLQQHISTRPESNFCLLLSFPRSGIPGTFNQLHKSLTLRCSTVPPLPTLPPTSQRFPPISSLPFPLSHSPNPHHSPPPVKKKEIL